MTESRAQKQSWLWGYGSPVTMGLWRMLFGLLAFVNFAMIAVDFDAWFTERGYVPAAVAQRWLGPELRINLLDGVTDVRITALVYGVVLLSALLTTIGLFTRVSSIVLAIGVISLHHRNALILHGGDTMLRLGVIYAAVAPSGRALSVDRLIALWRGRAPKVPAAVSLWPQRVMQLQIAIVYFTTVWHKSFGGTWRNGTASWYPPQLSEFDRLPVPPILDRQPFLAATTYGTLLVEFALATLVFYRPLRKYVLYAGVLLHAGIEYRFNIPLFGFVMVASYVAFFEGEEVSAWARRLGSSLARWRIAVRLPERRALADGPAQSIKAMDPLDLVSYESGVGQAFEAVDQRGRAVRPFAASALRSVGSWWFSWAPGIWRSVLTRAAVEDSGQHKPARGGRKEHARR